jgi:hypothetical protein
MEDRIMTILRSVFDDQVLESQIPLTLDSYTKWTIPSGESAMAYIGSTANLTNAGTITVTGDLLILSSGSTLVNSGTITVTGTLKVMEV